MKKITPKQIEEIIEKARELLKKRPRKEASPGLSAEARNFVIKY